MPPSFVSETIEYSTARLTLRDVTRVSHSEHTTRKLGSPGDLRSRGQEAEQQGARLGSGALSLSGLGSRRGGEWGGVRATKSLRVGLTVGVGQVFTIVRISHNYPFAK